MASKFIAVKVAESIQTLLDWYALAVGVKETSAYLYEIITSARKAHLFVGLKDQMC